MRAWVCAIGVLLVAACTSDDAPRDGRSSSPAPTAASVSITVDGDAALVAAFTRPDVRCGFPAVDGPSIALLSTTDSLVFRIRVQEDKVTVIVSNVGEAATDRTFVGTGVTGFDAAKGATIDAALTSSGSPGLTKIKGSVDCAEQSPGTSTLALSGARLEQIRVECNLLGDEVVVLAIADFGSQRALIELGLRGDGVDLGVVEDDGVTHYLGPAGAVTMTADGARVAADLVDDDTTPPGTLRLDGEVVCGTPIS